MDCLAISPDKEQLGTLDSDRKDPGRKVLIQSYPYPENHNVCMCICIYICLLGSSSLGMSVAIFLLPGWMTDGICRNFPSLEGLYDLERI